MQPLFEKQTDKIWKKISKPDQINDFTFDVNIYKRLLDFFMAGDYYYYVTNLRDMKFDLVSNEISEVLGYPRDQINVPMILSKIHPEDQSWFLNFESKVADFYSGLTMDRIPNYKVRYDYRIQKADGSYIRILQQVISVQFEDNRVIRTFGVHTDISHLKMHGTPVLSLIGMNGEPSYDDVKVDNLFEAGTTGLTRRETKILTLLAAENPAPKSVNNISSANIL
ncbi:PAS domain-containing protein [Pollutibacter soli]|uniref:PAS domain-containing protein n=1 Tax=Pollutibacter soli TaxID=3034157 RepID=UPI0030137F9B